MTVRGAALAGQRAALSLMVDRCMIAADVPPVYDPATDAYVTPPGAVRYTGPCRVKPRDNADRVVAAGEQTVSLWPYTVSVPLRARGVTVDDLLTVTSAGLDAGLVGLVLRVRDVPKGSLMTARRLGCELSS